MPVFLPSSPPPPATTLSSDPPLPFLERAEKESWGKALGNGEAYFQVISPPVSGCRMDFDQERGDIWQKLLMRD